MADNPISGVTYYTYGCLCEWNNVVILQNYGYEEIQIS